MQCCSLHSDCCDFSAIWVLLLVFGLKVVFCLSHLSILSNSYYFPNPHLFFLTILVYRHRKQQWFENMQSKHAVFFDAPKALPFNGTVVKGGNMIYFTCAYAYFLFVLDVDNGSLQRHILKLGLVNTATRPKKQSKTIFKQCKCANRSVLAQEFYHGLKKIINFYSEK